MARAGTHTEPAGERPQWRLPGMVRPAGGVPWR